MTRGRPKQFDEQKALEAAMQVFWAAGYEAASCEELLEAMGINAGSMYATFGDKQSLYERAFAHYCSLAAARSLERLNGPGSPLENVRGFVNCLAEIDKKGCMIANTLIEFGNQPTGVGRHARQVVTRLRKALEQKLTEAQEVGELGKESDPSAIAAFIVNTMQGLSVSVRAGIARDSLRGIVDTVLKVLQ